MKASLLGAVLFAALIAPVASAQQVRMLQCVATSVAPGTTHVTIYVSQLIGMDVGQSIPLSGAWATYVKSTYHVDALSAASCQPFAMNPAYQARALAAEEDAWKRQNIDVVHVTWKPGQSGSSSSGTSMYGTAPGFAGAAAAAPSPPTAPAAPSGPEPRASYCYSDEKKPTVYFSDPFDTADLPSAAAWQTAFGKMLAQKYSYKGTVACKNTATILSAQSAILEQKEALQGKQIVDTDWTYEPALAPTDSAAPAQPYP